MKQGRFTTLESFVTEVLRQKDDAHDIAAKNTSIILANPNTMIHTNGKASEYQMLPLGHEQLSSRLNIPKKYYDDIKTNHPDLLTHTVNYLLPKSNEGYLVRTLDSKVRAVLSPRYRPLDNAPLLNSIIQPLYNNGFELASAELTDTRMYFKVISKSMITEYKVGNAVRAGFWFQNSEVGHSRISGGLFIEFLNCLNGMKLNKDYGFARNHSGKAIDFNDNMEAYYTSATRQLDEQTYFAKITDVVNGMIGSPEGFKAVVQRFKDASEQKITGNPDKALEALSNSLLLSKEESVGVLRSLIKGGDLTRMGMANAFTDYSKEVADYDRATDFESYGGKIIELAQSDWNTIAQAA